MDAADRRFLPGEDLIGEGLADLSGGVESAAALLVSIGAPRLRRLGVPVPRPAADPERKLYELLARGGPDGAHSRYNALIRRLVSFERSVECAELADAQRVKRFMRELGQAATGEAIVYFTGGATAVLNGWRDTTIDVDLKLQPERDEILRAIPKLKEKLQINVELAAPDQFLPPLPGWEERSAFEAKEGPLVFRHYDYYAQALAKIERGHRQDLEDARQMRRLGLIQTPKLLELLELIAPALYRYHAVDPGSLRRAVEEFIADEK